MEKVYEKMRILSAVIALIGLPTGYAPALADTWTSGTNLTYINSNQVNVGIGTSTPTAPFTIRRDFGTATQGERNWLYMEQSGSGPAFSLGYRVEGTTPTRVFLGTGNSKPLDFRTSGALQAMTILNDGRVGINNPAPTAKFEVVSGNGDGIKAKASGTESSANFFLEPASANVNKRNWVLSAFADQHGDFSIRNSNVSTGNPYGATGTTRFLINRDGNIGIGTVNPSGKLEAVSSSSTDGYAIIANSNQDYKQLLVKASGSGNSASPLIKFSGGPNGYRSGTDGAEIYQNTTGDLKLNINSSKNAIVMKETGVMGIWTANDNLDADLKLGDNTGSYRFKIGGLTSGGGGLTFQNQVAPGTATSSSNPASGGFILYQNQDEAKGYARSMDIGTRDYADAWNGGSQIRFLTSGMAPSGTSGIQNSVERMVIDRLGKVGIGTSSPQALLHVRGSTKVEGALEVESVVTRTWTVAPDYVFEEDYKLRSLGEVESFVKKNKHLPEVPSAKEFKSKGMDLAEMNFVLLKKVEELTLHAIEHEKRSRAQEARINLLESRLAKGKVR